MSEKVQFELVSPEKLLVSQPVDMVVVPGGEGDFGILVGHSPMIATVRPGVIEMFEKDRVTARIFVAGGFAEVTAERCTVLAEEAINVQEIDLLAAEQAVRDLTEDVADAQTEADRNAAEAKLLVARARAAAAVTLH